MKLPAPWNDWEVYAKDHHGDRLGATSFFLSLTVGERPDPYEEPLLVHIEMKTVLPTLTLCIVPPPKVLFDGVIAMAKGESIKRSKIGEMNFSAGSQNLRAIELFPFAPYGDEWVTHAHFYTFSDVVDNDCELEMTTVSVGYSLEDGEEGYYTLAFTPLSIPPGPVSSVKGHDSTETAATLTGNDFGEGEGEGDEGGDKEGEESKAKGRKRHLKRKARELENSAKEKRQKATELKRRAKEMIREANELKSESCDFEGRACKLKREAYDLPKK